MSMISGARYHLDIICPERSYWFWFLIYFVSFSILLVDYLYLIPIYEHYLHSTSLHKHQVTFLKQPLLNFFNYSSTSLSFGIFLEKPKSQTFIPQFPSIRRFAGLRSLWIILVEWIKFIAQRILYNITMTWSSKIYVFSPLLFKRFLRSLSYSSMTINIYFNSSKFTFNNYQSFISLLLLLFSVLSYSSFS